MCDVMIPSKKLRRWSFDCAIGGYCGLAQFHERVVSIIESRLLPYRLFPFLNHDAVIICRDALSLQVVGCGRL